MADISGHTLPVKCQYICLLNYTWSYRKWGYVRTCRVTCSSLRPPRGLSVVWCMTLDFRKPPATTISTHTASRCCLLRLLITLSLFSDEEHTHKEDVCAVGDSCSTSPVHLFGYLWSVSDKPPHCFACRVYSRWVLIRTHLCFVSPHCTGVNIVWKKILGLHYWDKTFFLSLPAFEFQHRRTGKQQEIQWTASRATVTAPIKICTGGSRHNLLLPAKRWSIPRLKLCYLNMKLSGQNGPNCAAKVTDEAVEEGDAFCRIFSPKFAPLTHEP